MWGSGHLGSWGLLVWGSLFILVTHFHTRPPLTATTKPQAFNFIPSIFVLYLFPTSIFVFVFVFLSLYPQLTWHKGRPNCFFSWNKGKHDTNVTVREQLCLFCLSLTIDFYIPDLIWLSSSGLLLSTVYNSPPFCLGPAWNSKFVLEEVTTDSSFACILLWGEKKINWGVFFVVDNCVDFPSEVLTHSLDADVSANSQAKWNALGKYTHLPAADQSLSC